MHLDNIHIWDQLSKIGKLEIARSHFACLRAGIAAAGAGLITAGTAILKISLYHASLASPLLGVLGGINFAGSFLFIQAFGFRLATKQAPFLGAALGGHWRILVRRSGWQAFVDELGWSMRTLASSALGNLVVAMGGAYVFHLLFEATTGVAFLSPSAASHALRSFDPWETATLSYAAITGFFLWLCTHLAGTLAARLRPFSKTTVTTLFNLLFGFTLAFIPLIGKWAGLPLDVRHFALAGGTVALALGSLGVEQALESGLISALFGVLWIGTLNFSVSFALAFVASWRPAGSDDEGSGLPVLHEEAVAC